MSAVYRRGATPSSMSSSSARTSATTRAPAASTARRAPAASTSSASMAPVRRPVGSATGARVAPAKTAPNAAMQELTREMADMRVSVEALEKERDFYFGKVSLRSQRLRSLMIPTHRIADA